MNNKPTIIMTQTEIDIRKNKPETEWGGYTLEELRYQRALTAARIEINKELLMMRASQLYKGNFTQSVGHKSMFGRMLSTLSIFDYAIMAIKIGHKLTGIYRNIRR